MTHIAPTTEEKPNVERKPVNMPKDYLTFLKQLYILRSYSGFEEPMRNLICTCLESMNIDYINYNGNIVGINYPGNPLFSAHMDMVNADKYKLKGKETTVATNVFTIDEHTNIRLYTDAERKDQTSLGADDKNGIWCILSLLKEGFPINFVFSHGEEVGCVGIQQVVEDEELGILIESCKYGVIIDRRNAHDIIGYENKYCMAMDDKLQSYANKKGFPFKATSGLSSDANHISKLIECVNLSCGYYEPHSSKEYTNLNELWTTYKLLRLMVSEDNTFEYETVSPARMQKFKSCKSPYYVEPPKEEKKEVVIIDKSKDPRYERVWDYEKREYTYKLKDVKTSWDDDDEDIYGDNWYSRNIQKYNDYQKKTTGGTSSKEKEEDEDIEPEFDYSLEFKSDMQMMADDYTEIIAQGECLNCTSYGYFLWSDIEEAASYGYDIEDLDPVNQNIGVECMSCGSFMPLKEFKENLAKTSAM